MHQMIKEHDNQAQCSGARIIFSCGFDSIPFDLGVFFLQQISLKRLGIPCTAVKGRVRSMKGTFSGGVLVMLLMVQHLCTAFLFVPKPIDQAPLLVFVQHYQLLSKTNMFVTYWLILLL